MEGIPKKKISRRVLAAIAIVIVIVIILAAWILTPSMSPLASIHDADGDGHPDASDAAPNDPLLWASGSATVLATVHSTHLINSVHYTVSLNGVQKAEGDLAAGSSVTHSIAVNFLYGVNNYTTATVLATSTGGGFGAVSDQFSGNLVNGQTYPVTLNI
jgi:uncharacterized BrkB/YihY/UPF0761 family membrane protein